jgi:hypothetical protein
MAMSDQLVVAYAGSASAGRVLATVAVCRSELHRAGVKGAELIASTEALARARLAGQLGAHDYARRRPAARPVPLGRSAAAG